MTTWIPRVGEAAIEAAKVAPAIAALVITASPLLVVGWGQDQWLEAARDALWGIWLIGLTVALFSGFLIFRSVFRRYTFSLWTLVAAVLAGGVCYVADTGLNALPA